MTAQRTPLPPRAQQEIEEAYTRILDSTGFGKIRIYVEKGLTSRETVRVSLEVELEAKEPTEQETK